VSLMFSDYLPLLASAPDGIHKLRGLILELAMRGKLVPADPADEPASKLLKRIAAERNLLEAKGICKKSKVAPLSGDITRPFELPGGWQWARLGDIGLIGSSSRVHQKDWTTKGIPFYRAREIVKLSSKGFVENELFISESLYRNLSDGGLVPVAGDLMITGVGTIGVPYIVQQSDKFYFKDASVLIFKNYHRLCPEFLCTLMKSPYWIRRIHEESMGTTVHTLTIVRAKEVLLPLPPLAEQQRIVAKVNELMALCDRLENQQDGAQAAHSKLVDTLLRMLTQSTDSAEFGTNWHRLAEHFDVLFTTESSLEALKKTILQLAVMGKLVPQDANDEPASELLKQIAQKRVRLVAEGKTKKSKTMPPVREDEWPYAVPISWAWVRLSDVTAKITDGTHHSPSNLPTGEFKYISAKNIKQWGIDVSGMTFVTKAVHDEIFARCNPEFGDVLYIKDGATTGIAAINTLNEPFSMLSSVALLKPSIGLFNRYLYFLMSSPVFYDEMRAGMTGVAITRVTLAKLNTAILPLPPLAEQHRIVGKVDELMTFCNRLKADLAESRNRLAHLASILIESAPKAA
jgi:type I restriction enzyme S subunit